MVKKKEITEISNSLSNLVLGVASKSQLSSSDTISKNISTELLSNQRTTLSYAYKTFGLVQTLIDQPVEDGFRGGIEVKSDQLDSEDIKEIQNFINENKIIETFKNAIKWTRLYGGGGVVINTNGNSKSKLNPNLINKNSSLEFYDVDLWELNNQNVGTGTAIAKNNKIKSPFENNMEVPYCYYGVNLNKTRVLKMNGKKAPSFIRPMLRGWGMSEVERLVRSINQYLKNNDLIFELLDEAKIDIYKIQGFNSLLSSSSGTQKVQQRIELANTLKNYNKALVMDNEDDYLQKQMNFGGLSEMLKQIKENIASDMRMPLTKLFGRSASGFNSGEDDIENYNSMIESEIRHKFDCELIQIIKLICQKVFEFIPTDLRIEYKPLRILSAKDEEEVKDKKFNRALTLFQIGIITEEEFKQDINLNNLVSIDLDIENSNNNEDKKEEVKEKKNSIIDLIKNKFKIK